MKKSKRLAAALLAAGMTVGAMAPAAQAASLPIQYDETCYVTLDYYGELAQASVVKSYRLNGNDRITDYGSYDQVVNLTDGRAAQVTEDQVVFDLSGDTPEKFYFEGKTSRPFEELPWTMAVSYRHNGAPALAEELGGKSGLFEIDLDVTPRESASEYSKNNLILTAAAVFNDDDIVSLEAPGAQVQMVGNLRAVLFAVLPGEEQHFAIRVGSEDFSFSGWVLLAVPATLQQLDQVADLRQAKEKTEDSYHAIDESLDVILNSLEGMSGSMNAAANGLDRLNGARGTISNGKDRVYGAADLALADLNALADTLGKLDGYTGTASQAITDLQGAVNELNGSVQELKPEMENTRKTIEKIQKDTKDLRELLNDVEGYNKKATSIADSLADGLEDLDEEMDGLEVSLLKLRNALRGTTGVSKIKVSDIMGTTMIDVGGTQMSAAQLIENIANAQKAKEAYEATIQQKLAEAQAVNPAVTEEMIRAQLPMDAFLVAAGLATAETAGAMAQNIQALLAFTQTEDYQTLTETAASVEATVSLVNDKIAEVNGIITGLTKPTASVVDELAELCGTVGDKGVTDDLASLAALSRDLLKTLKEHEGEGASLLEHADELGDLAGRVTNSAQGALEQMDALNGVLSTYEPTLQSALVDVQTLSGSAQSTLHDTSTALSAAEELLRSSGAELDGGVGDSLSGLSSVLRKATVGLEQTDTIQNAKRTLSQLIEDEWNSRAGEDNNLLLMDAGAEAQSMTSARNSAPESIQYVMRTQEIKAEAVAEEKSEEQRQVDQGSFWDRIKAMLADFWRTITGLFSKK